MFCLALLVEQLTQKCKNSYKLFIIALVCIYTLCYHGALSCSFRMLCGYLSVVTKKGKTPVSSGIFPKAILLLLFSSLRSTDNSELCLAIHKFRAQIISAFVQPRKTYFLRVFPYQFFRNQITTLVVSIWGWMSFKSTFIYVPTGYNQIIIANHSHLRISADKRFWDLDILRL